jgi:hypothetical protein
MAIFKVLGLAVLLGLVFIAIAVVLLEPIEKAVGRSVLVVQLSLGCAGAIVGAIAGAAQAVVAAIEKKPEPLHPSGR